MADVIQLRRDTAANWTATNPTLHQGEKGIENDTGKEKTGDGVTAWNSLGYFNDHIFSGTNKIYTKIITGTTASTEGGTVTVTHNVSISNIISISVLVSSGGVLYMPEFSQTPGYLFHTSSNSTITEIRNDASSSENILSCSVTVTIIYKG